MRHHHRICGHAALEVVGMLPFMAFLIVLMLQCSEVFTRAVAAVAEAESQAAAAVAAQQRSSPPFRRPCLEDIPQPSSRVEPEGSAVGSGAWKRIIGAPQEVWHVAGPVCSE